MTQRIAILAGDGTVRNIGVYLDDFVPDGVMHVAVTGVVRVGDKWNGSMFVAGPPKPVEPEDPLVASIRILANILGGSAVGLVEAQLKRHGQ